MRPLGNNGASPASRLITLLAGILTSNSTLQCPLFSVLWKGKKYHKSTFNNRHWTQQHYLQHCILQPYLGISPLSSPLSSPLLCVRLYDKEFQRKITVTTSKISSLIYSWHFWRILHEIIWSKISRYLIRMCPAKPAWSPRWLKSDTMTRLN